MTQELSPEEALALAEKATPAPWMWHLRNDGGFSLYYSLRADPHPWGRWEISVPGIVTALVPTIETRGQFKRTCEALNIPSPSKEESGR